MCEFKEKCHYLKCDFNVISATKPLMGETKVQTHQWPRRICKDPQGSWQPLHLISQKWGPHRHRNLSIGYGHRPKSEQESKFDNIKNVHSNIKDILLKKKVYA